MTAFLRLCAFIGLTLLTLNTSWAQPAPQLGTLMLDGTQNTLPLAGRSTFWVDNSGTLSAQDVEAQYANLPFTVRAQGSRLLLPKGAALWVRFDAEVKDNSAHWELELTHSGTDRVSLYHRQAHGGWRAQQTPAPRAKRQARGRHLTR